MATQNSVNNSLKTATADQITFEQTGLKIKGGDTKTLTFKLNETVAADRILNLKVGGGDRSVQLDADLTVSATATVSGTNTGDISAANPTGTIGLTANNGVATTWMRSDATPALGVAIIPTWTGAHTFKQDNITTTPTDAIVLTNTTASTGGATVQMSPRLHFTSHGWNTAADKASDWTIDALPVSGSTANSILQFKYSYDSGTYDSMLTLGTTGPRQYVSSTGSRWMLFGGFSAPNSLNTGWGTAGETMLEIFNSAATSTNDINFSQLVLTTNRDGGTSNLVGHVVYANSASASTDKRLVTLSAYTDGATNSGQIRFYTNNAGTMAEKMRLTKEGFLALGRTATIAAAVDIITLATTTVGLRIQGIASQSGNYITIQDSTPTALFTMDSNGAIVSSTRALTSVTSEKTLFYSNPASITISTGYTDQKTNVFAAPVLSIATSQTVTNGSTLYLGGAPSNIGAGTLTNAYALFVDQGRVRIDDVLECNGSIEMPGTIFGITVNSTVATGDANFGFNDNKADALTFRESTNNLNFLTFKSTDNAEEVQVKQRLATKTGDAFVTPAYVGGTFSVNVTGVGNVGSGEDDLITCTCPAGILAKDGDYLEFEMGGTTAANGNNKTIKIKYGGTTIIDTGAVAANNETWTAKVIVVRTGATTQRIIANFAGGTLLTKISTYTTAAETLSGTVVFKCTGEATSNDDIRQELLICKWGNKG